METIGLVVGIIGTIITAISFYIQLAKEKKKSLYLSTALAYGYYNNFLLPISRVLNGVNKISIIKHGGDVNSFQADNDENIEAKKIKMKILIPEKFNLSHEGLFDNFEKVVIKTENSRPYLLYVNDKKEFFDIPSVVNNVNDLYEIFGTDYSKKTKSIKMEFENERNAFKRALSKLIRMNDTTRGNFVLEDLQN